MKRFPRKQNKWYFRASINERGGHVSKSYNLVYSFWKEVQFFKRLGIGGVNLKEGLYKIHTMEKTLSEQVYKP